MASSRTRAARADRDKRYRIDGKPITLGQCCEEGTQLRPDIVWFGEAVQHMEEAGALVASADKVLVVGTSLSVYPAAGLVEFARADAEKVLNALEMDDVPAGFAFHAGPATQVIPAITSRWLTATASLTSSTGTQALNECMTFSSRARRAPSLACSSWANKASRKRPSES